MKRRLESLLYANSACFFSQSKPGQSFYRRPLPSQLIALDSQEGKSIFREGLQQGHCQSFFTLVQQFITQSEVSTCSSATLAMILNTLKVDPGLNWKGIWRWYDDYNIKHMHPSKIEQGLTLQEFHQLARLNNVRSLAFSPLEECQVIPPPSIRKSSLNFFRNCLVSCNTSSDTFLTVNFNRKALGQTGTGHYSPIAGYNAKRDLALILDVAKFKYDSYWCPLSHLYQALKALDNVSKISRGFIINKKHLDFQGLEINSLFTSVSQAKRKRLLDILGSGTNLVQNTVKIINQETLHSYLVPILYEYATNQIQGLQEIIINKSNEICDNFSLQSSRNQDIFNPEAQVLMKAFNKSNSISDVFRFLLVLFHLHKTPNAIFQLRRHQNEDCWKRWCDMFQGMLFYLQKSKRKY